MQKQQPISLLTISQKAQGAKAAAAILEKMDAEAAANILAAISQNAQGAKAAAAILAKMDPVKAANILAEMAAYNAEAAANILAEMATYNAEAAANILATMSQNAQGAKAAAAILAEIAKDDHKDILTVCSLFMDVYIKVQAKFDAIIDQLNKIDSKINFEETSGSIYVGECKDGKTWKRHYAICKWQ